jgi:hypothetical protein
VAAEVVDLVVVLAGVAVVQADFVLEQLFV